MSDKKVTIELSQEESVWLDQSLRAYANHLGPSSNIPLIREWQNRVTKLASKVQHSILEQKS